MKRGGYGYVWQPPAEQLPFIINAAHLIRTGNWRNRQPISHPQWVLDYTFTHYGRCKVDGDEQGWRERPAQVAHLYPPHRSYWEDTLSAKNPIVSARLVFCGGAAVGLNRLIPSHLGYARFLDPDGLLGDAFHTMTRIARDYGAAGFLKAQALLYEILHLLRHSVSVAVGAYSIRPEASKRMEKLSLAEKVDAYLRDHFMERVVLTSLASHCHVSLSNLSHRYQTGTGQSPITKLIALRIQHAKNLLIKGLPLKVIAKETGFCDAGHLSKTFKRVAGISPRRFLSAFAQAPADTSAINDRRR